jgi:hypothetical protein
MTEFDIAGNDFERAADALTAAHFEKVAGKIVAGALRADANLVRKNVRAELRPHRRTGKLRDKVKVKFNGFGLKTVAGVRSTGAQSNLIAGGVRPHAISPGKVMPLWRGGSISGFATAVQHPGFGADPFFSRAVRKSLAEIDRIGQEAIDQMARELASRMEG